MLLVVVLAVVWLAAGFLSFRSGVEDANARLPKAVEASLAPQDGLLLSKPSLILLLGTDGDMTAARADARRSDSILLVRTDPDRNRLMYLSIPRDLRVDIPGFGPNKINAAFQLGGPTLTMRTVRALTGLQPNHVVIVDFDDFRSVIDALGGVEIDVPKPILSNRFDCPYATEARCQQWQGWRFERGKQTMNGQRALDLLARARKPARPRRERPHPRRAAAGGRRGDDRQARQPRHVPQAPVHRRRPRRAAHDRPLGRAAAPARLGPVPRQRRPRASTAASAASRRSSAASRC